MARRSRLLVLAVDIGSSSARSALFDERGKRVAGTSASREYQVQYGADGSAVLNPRKLCDSVRGCVGETLRGHGKIAAIGASAFWHSLLGLDRNHRPITPIYMWADARAAPDAGRLRERFDERVVQSRTGCMLRASFWPAKLVWLRRVDLALFRRVRFWVSPADWIMRELFDAAGTSVSVASATGLFNRQQNAWDEELCFVCRVPTSALDEVRAVAAVGSGGQGPRLQLGPATTVFSAIGDGAASNLGCGADRPGTCAINIGTSAAVRTLRGRDRARIPLGLFRYALDHERDVIGGAVSNAGNLRRWCLRELRIDARRSSRLTEWDRIAAATSRLDVLPFWVEERAPTWPEDIGGVVTGLSQAATALEIERAAQCSVFYRLAQNLELTENASGRARELIVSGGIVRAPELIQLLADAIGRDVAIAREQEASLRGAAVYALQKIGCRPAALPRGRIIKHDRQLSSLHRERQSRQEDLEAKFL